MGDAWETLVAGSSIPSGDAWEHLNAQSGGGGVIIGGDLSADVDNRVSADAGESLSANIGSNAVTADAGLSLSAHAENDNREAEACPPS